MTLVSLQDDGALPRLPGVVSLMAVSFSAMVLFSASWSSFPEGHPDPQELDASRATYVTAEGAHPRGSDLVAHSGGDASQTGKHTWMASDPVRLAEWWLEHLPTSAWMVGNYTTDGGCATYGKVFVGNDSTTGLHGVNAPFQLHAVRAWKRPSGALSARELEARYSAGVEAWGFDERAASSNSGAYATHALAPLLEHHVALYTDDLAWYARSFSTAGVVFASLSWTGARRFSDDDARFLSLVVHVPDSLVVLELVGPSFVGKAADRATSSWRRLAYALPPSAHVSSRDDRGRPSLTAVKLSYATTDAARLSAWAQQVLSMTPLADDDGVPASSFDEKGGLAGAANFGVVARALSWTKDVAPIEVHFVQPAAYAQSIEAALAANAPEPALTVAAYEAYAAAVHAQCTGPNCPGCSDVEGFDRLMDTHFGRRLLSAGGEAARELDDHLDAARRLGAALTVFSKNDAYFLYVASPSVAVAQLTGSFAAPPADVRTFDTCRV